MLKLPKFLRRLFQRDSSPPPPRPTPITEAVKQVSVFMEAIKIKDKRMLLALFSGSEEIEKIMNEFIETYQGIELRIQSAVYTKQGDINVKIIFSDTETKNRIRGQWLLAQSFESPTGWKVKKISQSRFTFQMFFG